MLYIFNLNHCHYVSSPWSCETLPYWNDGEPNDWASNEDCGHIRTGSSSIAYHNMLNDDICTKQKPFICDANPISASKNKTGCNGADIYVHCDDVLYVYYGHNVSNESSSTGPEYEYIGCYRDTSTRALNGGPNGKDMTIEECWASCPEYKYFALQDGHGTSQGECRCGNSLSEATRYGTSSACDTTMGTGNN